ncbi:MAG: hypothetical protein JNL03_09440 [Prolixibacteraceae bacterium]|nr:hypothetical protein [Prolixibacteraceae bacterium]
MKNNNEVLEIFDQSNAEISKLFWIAGCFESSDLQEFLEEQEDNFWKEILPEINEDDLESYREDDELNRLLIDNNKLGFIAEVGFAKHSNFHFNDKGKVTSGSIHPGIRHLRYIYAETAVELAEKVKNAGQEEYEKDLEQFKLKNNIPTNKQA